MDINNREIASLIWIGIFIIWCFVFSKKRNELFDTAKSLIGTFFSKQIMLICLLLFLYISFEIYFLWKINFWEFSLLKETILWSFVAFGTLMTVNDRGTYQEKLKNILLKSLTFSVIIEYVVNIFSFSLIIELIAYPVLVFLAIIQVVASYKEEHKALLNPTNKILGLFAVFLICYTFYTVLSNPEKFNTALEFKKLTIPFLLTIIYMPFPYIFFIYIIHENIRVVVQWSSKDKSIVNTVTLKVLLKFKLNLFALKNWREHAELYRIKSKEDISSVIY